MVLSRRNRELYAQDELRRLRGENARLKELLIQHGVAWEEPAIPEPVPDPTESAPTPAHFTTDDKIALFRRLFPGARGCLSAALGVVQGHIRLFTGMRQ
ncbi:MAG: hypothetical protein JW706_04345 [Opitutales bacterium]|nr:hypothetical protein [Opitutales bacterium]